MENGNKYARLEVIMEETARLLKEAGKKNCLSSIEKDLILDKLRDAYNSLVFDDTAPEGNYEGTPEPTGKPTEKSVRQDPGPTSELPELSPDETELTSAVYREETAGTDPDTRPVIPSAAADTGVTASHNSSRDNRKKTPEIIADRISQPHAFRNEALGQVRQQKDLSSRIQNKPIHDIAKAIGINDKFHFIRELFGGDNTLYENTIRVLNESPDFNQAFDYLNQHFEWDMEDPSVKKLLELTRRKFIARKNE